MYERRRKVMETDTIIHNDCLDALKDMPSESVHCCVTSSREMNLALIQDRLSGNVVWI